MSLDRIAEVTEYSPGQLLAAFTLALGVIGAPVLAKALADNSSSVDTAGLKVNTAALEAIVRE